MKILLVAGHGNGDCGAVGCGYQEADLTRELVWLLHEKLLPYADVDVFDTAQNMYAYLKKHSFDFTRYDYVLENHFNSCVDDETGDGKTTGTEILLHPTEGGKTVETMMLQNICALGFRNRGIKTRTNLRNMNICKGQQDVSYALIETCFIDDADDMNLYQTTKNQVATGIANGIIVGFGLGEAIKAVTDFDDICAHYAEKHIEKLLYYGVVNGYGDGTFRPDNAVTRAEFATMIVNALEKACGHKFDSLTAFSDISGHWAENSIKKLVACGIVNGFVDGTFKPDAEITRGQAALMTSNTLSYCEMPLKGGDGFPDTTGHYAEKHITSLSTYGVVNGYEDGLFRPENIITRGQAAIFVANALTILGK